MKNKFGTMKFGKPYKTYISPARKKRLSRWGIVLLVIGTVTYCIFSAVLSLSPLIEDISQKMLEVKATEIINTAVLENIEGDIYSKLMNVTYNDAEQITSITANTAEMNKLKSALAIEILNRVEQFGSEGFHVPLGNLTDIVLLSGIGPEIPFRIIPYGNIKVDFRSEFSSTGINQTYHEIYIDVTAELKAISAVAGVGTNVTTSVMAAQTIIVGDTPHFYSK